MTVPSGWAGNILVAVSVSVLVIKKSAGKRIEVIIYLSCEQSLQRSSLFRATQRNVVLTERVSRRAGGVKKRGVEAGDGGMIRLSVAGEFEISPIGFQSSPEIANQHHWPVVEPGMMVIAGIAHEHNQSIVEHGSVAFFHRIQLRGELCDLPRVQLMDHDAVLFFRFAVVLFSVAEAVKIRQPQFREFPESLPPRTGSYRDHIGQAGDQCGASDLELCLENF